MKEVVEPVYGLKLLIGIYAGFIFKDQLVHNYFKTSQTHTKMANQAQFVKIVHLNHSVALVAL